MATQELRKVTLVGLQKDKAKVLDFLQTKGVMHINDVDSIKNVYDLPRDSPVYILDRISGGLLELRWMDEHLPGDKTVQHEFKHREVLPALKELFLLKRELHQPLAKLIKEKSKLNGELQEANATLDLLTKIPFTENLGHEGPITFSILTEEPDLKEKLNMKEILKEFRVSLIRKGKIAVIQGLTKDRHEIERAIKQHGITIMHVPKLKESKAKTISNAQKIVRDCQNQIKKIDNKLQVLANKHLHQIHQLQDELTIFHDRYEMATSFLRTKQTFMAQGYISTHDIFHLEELNKIAKVHVTFKRVKKGPTKLKNIPYVNRFEFITKMFGVPQYGRVDPTMYIAFFLPLFFGFMFSDIGYGLLLLLSSLVLAKKFIHKAPIFVDAAFVLGTCSLTTILFGAMFGSFFGNLFGMTPVLFDPFQKALYVLVISLVVGLVHLNLGLLIAAYENIRQGKLKEVIYEQGSTFSLQAACALIPFNPNAGYATLGVSVLLFLWKGSLMGLMDITGFVGTWFSYARLLALGLATGGIALGINIMAEQMKAIAVIGPVLFIVFLIGGHLFNFVLNVLGSSIHSVRLHYIEFFSQFYEGGGKPFKEFSTKRVKDSL